MASYRKLKNGKYEVRFSLKRGGEITPRSKTVENREEAKATCEEIERAKRRNEYVVEDKVPFSPWLDNWIQSYRRNIAGTTYIGYVKNAVKAKEYFGNTYLKEITPEEIDRFYSYLMYKKNLSSTSVQRVHSLLHRAFKDAVINNKMVKNPTDYVVKPKARDVDWVIPDEDAVLDLLHKLYDTPYYIPILLGAMLGLRRSEILALRWTDIDFKRCIVSINKAWTLRSDGVYDLNPTKTKRSKRSLNAPQNLIDALAQWRDQQKFNQKRYGASYHVSEFVCTYKNGEKISIDGISKIVPNTLVELGYSRSRLHDLRHANFTALLKAGVPIQVVSARAGHSQTSTTVNIYAHVMANMDKEAAKQIGEIYRI